MGINEKISTMTQIIRAGFLNQRVAPLHNTKAV